MILRLVIRVLLAVAVLVDAGSVYAQQMEPGLVQNAIEHPEMLHAYVRSGAAQQRATTLGPLAATVSDQFAQLVRYPAEEQTFLAMSGSIAYFRDFFGGGETLSFGANDGDTLNATFISPTGQPILGNPVTFHSSFNGQQDCWVSFSFVQCNSTSIDIIWFTTIQCSATGDFSMTFTRNGVPFASDVTFHVTPTIPPDKVAGTGSAYNQGTFLSTQYGNFCRYFDSVKKKNVVRACDPVNHPTEQTMYISALGCYLTDLTTMLQYQGVTTSVPNLNTWLLNNGGFNESGGIVPDAVLKFAKQNGVTLSFRRTDSKTGFAGGDAAGLPARAAVCGKGPTPLLVKHHDRNGNLRQHFVLDWGRDDAKPETTFLIKDPNGGSDLRLNNATVPRDYSNTYYGTREYQKPGQTFVLSPTVTVTLHSPAELVLTNSAGQKTGFDPSTNTEFNQIPNATYGDDSIDDPNDDSGDPASTDEKVLDLRPPANDTYTLTVIGTGSGTYDLEFRAFDSNLQQSLTPVLNIPVSQGSTQTFSFTTPIATGAGFPLSGGFDGGGQRPKDVNHFLSYANPTQSQTDLPAGTAAFPLLIFYDSRDIAASFSAVLNRADISSLFHPAAGTFEPIQIPLQSGRNVLELSIAGNLPNRVATDSDRLVFNVP